MKKIVLLLTLLIVSSISIGQTTTGTSTTTKYFYCELRCTWNNASKTKIVPDFGVEETSLFQDAKMKEAEIEKIKNFNSKIDALNYMTDKGWELVETQTPFQEIGFNFFYLLRKKKD